MPPTAVSPSSCPSSAASATPPPTGEVAWGYLTAPDAVQFERLLRDQFEALQSSPILAGFCYTQLTDVLQEANGLTDPQRRPKLPLETIRDIVLGKAVDISTHRRPKKPVEQPFTVSAAPSIRASAHNKSVTADHAGTSQ